MPQPSTPYPRRSRGPCHGSWTLACGAIFIIMGLVGFAHEFGYTRINIGQLWPLWLIAWGVMMYGGWGSRSRYDNGDRHE